MENIKSISLPTVIEVEEVKDKKNTALIMVSPCYPGYGTTLGNALRRVLLSSLPGAAATAFKIKGVDHEFSTIDGIQEDMVEIILNIKSLRFRLHGEEPVELELKAKGEGTVVASQFKQNSQVEIVNPDAHIATITSKDTELSLKVLVEPGRGYVPVEAREKDKQALGYISIDTIYTPVKNVNFKTEHVRVGQMTNYDKLLLHIVTDGTVKPLAAFRAAATILVEQFHGLVNLPTRDEAAVAASVASDQVTEAANSSESVEEVEAEEADDKSNSSTGESAETEE